MVAGEFVAVLITETFPDALPVTDGAKLTENARLWPGARATDPLNPETANAVLLVATWEIVTLPVPEFVTESGKEAEAPKSRDPKLSEFGLGDKRYVAGGGTDEAIPVPETAIVRLPL